jgi:choline dehydrogenase
VLVTANPVQPRSEGEIVLAGTDPFDHPVIRMNYLADTHDMRVMIATIRRALDIVAHWPSHRTIGPLLVPPLWPPGTDTPMAIPRAMLFSKT